MTNKYDFSALSEFLDYITSVRIPGNECIVYKNNERVFDYVSGFSDISSKKKMEKGLLYNMYSATKPITCTGVMKLIENGKISLDAPISLYLPEFSEMYIKDGENIKKAEKQITVRHLLSHTSGIAFNVRTKHILNAKKEGRISTREIVKEIAKDYLSFEPGDSWLYGLSHDVLGALIEEVSGEKFGDFLKNYIFTPLGMENTSFHLKKEDEEKIATQYFYNKEERKVQKVLNKNNFKLTDEYEAGGAGLISTAEDYIKFVSAMTNLGMGLNGERILKEETVNLMRETTLNENQQKAFIWESMPDYTYGLGVRVMKERDKFGSPSSNGEFGWGGAGGVYMLSDPENKLSIVYFQHMLESWEEFVHPRLRNLVYKITKN